MNFYSFHIGDYMTKTRHLSWEEDMAYRRLLDVYYGTEKPLPADKKAVYRLVLAQTAKHRQAVDVVLAEFFALTDDGWRNARCDGEIDAAAEKRDKAAQSARRRWEAERAKQTQSEGNANAMRTHSEGNAPTPTPNPSISGEVVARARGGDLEALQAVLREAAGWQNEPAPKLHVTGPVAALMAAGADLDLDVIPTVRSTAHQASSRASWNYFLKAIARARDERIAAAKIVTHPNAMRPANGQDRKRGNSILEAGAQLDAILTERIREAEAREGIEPGADQGARDVR
jgi:uncharacterized protein YdaU (DUF1376 family)